MSIAPSDDDAPDSDLIALAKAGALARNAPHRQAALAVGYLACAPLLHSTWKAAVWMTAAAGVLALQWLLARRLGTAAHAQSAPAALRSATGGALAAGAVWGAGALLLAPGPPGESHLAFGLLAAAASLPALQSWASHRPASQAFWLAALLPALGWLLWPPHAGSWAVPAALAALLMVALFLGRQQSEAFASSVQERLQVDRQCRDLASERDAAIAANAAKSRFITAASHDLRQPMHALSIQLESLDIPGVPAGARTALARIRSSVGNLNQMFESLLDISRLDVAAYAPGERLFRLPDFASGLSEVAAPLAARRSVAFRVESLEDAVRGDEKLLRQVVLNLLANALAYTTHGEVALRLLNEGGCLCIEVSDTGSGIAEEDRRRIFTEFFRADRTRVQHDGLGLGLTIVRRACDLIGAQVEVASELGRGSTFRVVTNYRLQQAPAAFLPQPAAGGLAIPSLHGKCIAVIEDDPNIVEAYRDAFARRGAMVVALSEKIDAMDREVAQLTRLDLIVSDFRLRDTTGDLLIQRLRENFNEDIPAVVVTADTAPEHAERFRRMDVELLHKPLSFRTLLATAEALLLRASVPASD